jgi:hypothetical protein
MSRWGDGSVCKSESGDRYREGTEILRRGRETDRDSERERLREKQMAAFAQRQARRREAYDPEADRQRRYGAYMGAAGTGGAVVGGYGVRNLRRANKPLPRGGLLVPRKAAGQLGGAAALLGGAGYLLHRSGKRENKGWR